MNSDNPNDLLRPQPNQLLNQSLAGIARDLDNLSYRLKQLEGQEKPGNFTAGSVLFGSSDGRLTQDSTNLSWDDANNRLTVTGLKILGAGTSFPASPPTNGLWYRTDLHWWCEYDGTRWLTAHELVMPLQTARSVTSAGGTTLIGEVMLRQDYAPYFTRHTTAHSVTGTNNGANFWTFAYRTMTTAGAVGTTIVTWNTGADGAAVTFHDGTTTTTATSYGSVQLIVTTSGTPGAVTIYGAALWYRLIIP